MHMISASSWASGVTHLAGVLLHHCLMYHQELALRDAHNRCGGTLWITLLVLFLRVLDDPNASDCARSLSRARSLSCYPPMASDCARSLAIIAHASDRTHPLAANRTPGPSARSASTHLNEMNWVNRMTTRRCCGTSCDSGTHSSARACALPVAPSEPTRGTTPFAFSFLKYE